MTLALKRYGLGILACVGALLVTTQLHAILDSGSFLLFLGAVVVSAAYGGLGPGLVVTALSVALIDFFFLGPRFTLRVVATADLILLAVYAAVAVCASWVSEWLRAGRERAEAQAKQAAAVARLFERHLADLERDDAARSEHERLMLLQQDLFNAPSKPPRNVS